MKGDVMAPLISSNQVDIMGRECLEEGKALSTEKLLCPDLPEVFDISQHWSVIWKKQRIQFQETFENKDKRSCIQTFNWRKTNKNGEPKL